MKALRSILVDQRGLTLIEMTVGLALSAIAMAVLFGMFVGTQSMYYDTRDMAGDTGDARVVLSMLSQEIRSAGCDPTGLGLDGIAHATLDTLRLQSDLDGDQAIEFTLPPEDVTYAYDPSQKALMRDTGTGATVFMRGLESLTFSYRDAAGNTVGGAALTPAERARVAVVGITMTLRRFDEELVDIEGSFSLRNQ